MVATANSSCAAVLGVRLQHANRILAERWLDRLVALVPVEARSVFPSDLLLDHIPGLIDEIGKFVADPAEEDIAARTIVIDKARELGQLRHQQQASLHQVLREYDLLGEILGVVRELRQMAVVCAEHAARLNGRADSEPRDGAH